MRNADPRIDPMAPPVRVKQYPNLPWRCQFMCPAEQGEGCKSGDGECLPDKVRRPSVLRGGGIMALLLLIVALGCTDATAPCGDVGHYALSSVAGHPLPVSSNIGSYRGGSLELRADSTFVDVLVIGNLVDSVFGRYRVDADSIRMTPDDWTPYAVKREGDVIRAHWGEGIFLYRRD